MAALLLCDVLGVDLYDGAPTLPALLLLTFSAGFHARTRRRAMVGFCLGSLGLVANAPWLHGYSLGGEVAFDAIVVTGLPLLGGRVLRRRAELVATLEVRRAELELERESRVVDAAAAERLRMARDLHDVIVGDVSAMVGKAAAARGVVTERPEVAVVMIGELEAGGRVVLNELRRVLGVLRTPGTPGASVAPAPSFAELAPLLARQPHGLVVTLDLQDSAGLVPPDLQLVGYRLAEHLLELCPPCRGTMGVAVAAGSVCLELRVDAPSEAWPSLGTVHRRVGMHGGRLDVEGGQGGSRLRVTLPLHVPADLP
ncbi:MAG: sensor histidine kinase [Frankiales bacterium]|nr:sensor histidine kinase [Frankiales bacterium]